jgi:hypothetical protein
MRARVCSFFCFCSKFFLPCGTFHNVGKKKAKKSPEPVKVRGDYYLRWSAVATKPASLMRFLHAASQPQNGSLLAAGFRVR